MFVKRGQRLVLEAWNANGASYFAWDPVFATAPAAQARRINLAGVVQPLADLRQALSLAARALARLGAGLVRLAWALLARGAGGVASRAHPTPPCNAALRGNGR
jgi:hypothetical protein